MKKFLSCAALLLLSSVAGSPLLAECSLTAPQSAARWPKAGPPESSAKPAQPDLDEVLKGALGSALERMPPPQNCGYTACFQTPEGCGCEGFYCNGIFICGYPWI
jgi:hypothetical protein